VDHSSVIIAVHCAAKHVAMSKHRMQMALMLLHRMLPWSNKSVAVLLSIAGQGQYRPQHDIKMMHDE